MDRILLLLDHKGNRRLLAGALGGRYEVVAANGDDAALDGAFDLCVVDGVTLDRLRDRIKARKAAEPFAFLPFLFVTSRQGVGMATQRLWESVDELLLSPIEKVELSARVENLLQRRRLSRETNRTLIRTSPQGNVSGAMAEDALAQNAALLQAIIDTVPECVKLVAPDGSLLDMNRAGLDMLEADFLEQVVGQSVYSLVEPSHRSAFEQMIASVFRGESGRLEFEIIGLKGARRWVDSHAVPFRNPNGDVIAALCITRDVTERKQAEEALKESHQRLVTTLESMTDGFVSFDPQMNYTYVNKWGGELLGRKPEDLIGKNYWTEYPEARGTPFANAYARALETQTPVFFEDYYAPWDRWFENRIYPSPDGLSIYFHEITARKRAEIALRESEERLARIVETAPDGIAIVDVSGGISFANAAAERILRLTRRDITQRFYDDPAWKITTANGKPFPREDLPVARALQTNAPVYGIEQAIEHSDGTRVILSINAAPLRDAAGEVVGVVASFSDVTAHKRAESELRRSQASLEEAQAQAQLGNWELDPVTQTGYWSKELFRLFGRDVSLGSPSFAEFLEMVHPDDRNAILRTNERGMAQDATVALEFRSHPERGQPRTFHAMVHAVHDAEGHLLRFVGTVQDITARKQVEEALRRAYEELEDRVAERTRELQEANVRLREIDRLKSGFLATMSHELRTPLNSILGFTGIILQGYTGAINDEQRKQLGMVYNSAKHLLQLINDILDLARIEAGRMEVFRQEFPLQEVVEEVILSLTPTAAQKGLRLVVDAPEETVKIVSDRKKVYQVLLNLVNNAVKFTERGEVRVECRTSDGSLVVSVSDTGIGIKEENMDMLFEAFRQVDGSVRRRYEGTGLGLYLSQKLVTMLGGRIWAESEHGKGSRFAFALPL